MKMLRKLWTSAMVFAMVLLPQLVFAAGAPMLPVDALLLGHVFAHPLVYSLLMTAD